ncbi:hypothetical protein JYQ62_02155 [Nostoc sp. UHCC 0702]|nr:hypothetical protein JYQ62_02155 [Nostoc sp. UHCC 0702]
MSKPLTAFQLLTQIRKLIPQKRKDSAAIISYLKQQGYIEELTPCKFSIKPGVTLTSEDVSKIASVF